MDEEQKKAIEKIVKMTLKIQQQDKKDQEQKENFSKKVVKKVIRMNIIFTLFILILFYFKGTEPSTLITAWFSFTTVELWNLSRITINKEKNKKQEEVNE